MSNSHDVANPVHARLGLRCAPFPPTPDAEHYFHTPGLEKRLTEAGHCLSTRKGFLLVTGEIGTGKSTFLRQLLALLTASQPIKTSIVLNTFLQGDELLGAILKDFGLPVSAQSGENVDLLNAFLLKQWQAGALCILCIDDAQNLNIQSLELVRLLSNLESGQDKLLQILLCGQPELVGSLGRPEIRQLASRIVEHVRLLPMDRAETARYAAFRLVASGAAGRISLTPRATRALYRLTRGNGRRIHQILDRTLYGVLQQGHGLIDAPLIRLAAAQAGMTQAKATRDRKKVRYIATGVMTAGLLAAGGLYASNQRHLSQAGDGAVSHPGLSRSASGSATAPSVPGATPPAGCLDRLIAKANDPSRPLLWVPDASAHLVALASDHDDICIQRTEGQVGLFWRAPWRPEDFTTGQAHPSVKALQHRLATARLYPSEPDGVYGVQTRQALSRFQRENALPPTGNPDPATLLLATLATLAAPPQELENE